MHVSRTGKLSPVALMMTNEVPLGTKGARAPLMRNSKPRLAEQSESEIEILTANQNLLSGVCTNWDIRTANHGLLCRANFGLRQESFKSFVLSTRLFFRPTSIVLELRS